MHWNHRVFRRYADINGNPEPFYTIHEVYYEDDDTETIIGYIEEEKSPWGQDVTELKTVLAWMLDACDKPVIDINELEEYFSNLPPQDPEGPYEVFNSAEEMLAALDSWEDDGGNSRDTGQSDLH